MKKNSEEYKLIQRLKRRLNQAIKEYKLIEDGDHILLGISGGKDSLALAELLADRAKIFMPKFKISAVHVMMTNINYESDHTYMREFFERINVPLYIREASFTEDEKSRKSPCFICSWTRRKELFALAKELGCNKIALGHHMDDILATLLMNMTFQGSFSTMPPMLQMRKFDMQIIRPMCLIEEPDLIAYAKLREYMKLKKECPFDKDSNRKVMGDILKDLQNISPKTRYSLWASMTNIHPELLPIVKLDD